MSMKKSFKTPITILGICVSFYLVFVKVLHALNWRSMSVDGGQYFNIAQNIQSGDGFVSDMALYHMGFSNLPHPSSIYPLWPLLLGYCGTIWDLKFLAWFLPALLYCLSLFAAYVLGKRHSPKIQIYQGKYTLHGGHLLVVLLGLNAAYFQVTSQPYTEALAYSILLCAFMRFHVLWNRPSSSIAKDLLVGLESGLWLAALWLTRSQMLLVVIATILTILFALLSRPNKHIRLRWMVGLFIGLGIPLWLRMLHIWSFSPETGLEVLIRFDKIKLPYTLSSIPFMLETQSLGHYMHDRFGGFLAAFSPKGDFAYANIFFACIYFLPLALLAYLIRQEDTFYNKIIALKTWLKTASLYDIFLWVFALGSFFSLHHIHKVYFTPWHFSTRHAIPIIFLIYLCASFCLRQKTKFIQIISLLLLLATIVHGIQDTAKRTRRAIRQDMLYFEDERQELVTWLKELVHREPGVRVGFDSQEAPRVTWAVPGLVSDALHWSTTIEDIQIFRDKLGTDYIVLRNEGHRDLIADGPPVFFQAREELDKLFEPVHTNLRAYFVLRSRN